MPKSKTTPKSRNSRRQTQPSLLATALSSTKGQFLAAVAIVAALAIGYLVLHYSHAATAYVHVSGGAIYDGSGNHTVLSGVDGGGWMTRGEGNTADRCGKTWSDAPEQAAGIKQMGMNTERIAITWANLEPAAPTKNPDGSLTHHWNTQYLAALDGLIQADRNAGIMAIIDMHQAEGFSTFFTVGNACEGNGQPRWLYTTVSDTKGGLETAKCEFFSDVAESGVPEKPQEGMAAAWRMLGARYDGNTTVIGADMFNEPLWGNCPGADLAGFYETVGNAIRQANQNIILMYEDNAYDSYMRIGMKLERKPNLTNALYSWHLYAPDWATGQAPMAAHLARAKAWGVPLWIGETDAMGATRTADLTDAQRPELKQQMDYFKNNDISWTLWGYDNGCCSLVTGGSNSPKTALISFLKPYMQKPATGTPTPTPTPTSITKTTTLSDAADTYLDANHPYATHADSDPLWASAYVYRALLRFNTGGVVPTGYHVSDVKLKLHITNLTGSGGGLEVHSEAANWTTTGTNWNNQPTWDNAIMATSGTPTAGSWLSIDLPNSSVNRSADTNLGLRYSDAYVYAQFNSLDSLSKPQLVVTYTSN